MQSQTVCCLSLHLFIVSNNASDSVCVALQRVVVSEAQRTRRVSTNGTRYSVVFSRGLWP